MIDGNIVSIMQLLRDAGVLGALLFALMGGWRRWWVWGWAYDEKAQEAKEWRELALSGTTIAERMVDIQRRGGRP